MIDQSCQGRERGSGAVACQVHQAKPTAHHFATQVHSSGSSHSHPGRQSANLGSVSSTLDDLKNLLPHVELPRFPPVVRRLRKSLQLGSEQQHEAPSASSRHPDHEPNCQRGRKHRNNDNTLATRDIEREKDVIAVEATGGRKRAYKRLQPELRKDGNFEIVQEHQSPIKGLTNLWASFLVPQGYPKSVSPQYKEYMFWRGIQYFFGGALSVFTTRALLSAVGIKRNASMSAAAINWVVKDGAGRLGRFLFARWGHRLDCELKQFRLLGDLLMQTGAVLELSTMAMPKQFLALACTANLLKNVGAVSASATRAPIYRSFALQNNMADVTAKGESVANLSDIAGVGFGIVLARQHWPIICTFAMLSLGYLIASRKEVDAVVLPYMNRARLAYAMNAFLQTGQLPDVQQGNKKEPLIPLGARWNGYGQVVLGASIETACDSPAHLSRALAAAGASPFVMTYRPEKDKVFVMLREGIDSSSALHAAFLAHLWLHKLRTETKPSAPRCMPALPAACSTADWDAPMAAAQKAYKETWKEFSHQANGLGWHLQSTMLDLGGTRLQPMKY